MIRRAQSVRSRATHNVTPSDDLGTLRENEQSIEEVLRQDLAAARRENDKLQGQVDSLNSALRARPPIERVQELEKEFHSLELLLHGTQKENERAMADLDRVRNREKLMERELKKFAGDDWEECLNLSTAFSSLSSVRPIGINLARSTDTSLASLASSFSSTAMTEKPAQFVSSTDATLAHMEQIRTMLVGMAERLQSGEEKLQQVVDRAEQEKRELEEMMKSEPGITA